MADDLKIHPEWTPYVRSYKAGSICPYQARGFKPPKKPETKSKKSATRKSTYKPPGKSSISYSYYKPPTKSSISYNPGKKTTMYSKGK